MKLNKSSIRLFLIFALFAVIIFTLLFLMQTVFLQKFFESSLASSAAAGNAHSGIHNPYLQSEFLRQTKVVLKLQLVAVTLVSFVLAFVFTVILSRHLSNEKSQKVRMELLSNITHDLRTPLTLIKGYAENLQEYSWQTEKDRVHDTQIIIRESDRLSSLVNDILEYSSVQEAKKSIKKEKFDLSGLAAAVINQFGTEKITLNLEKDCFINAGKAEIERVLYNFIDNALRHCDEKGVSVSTEKKGSKITLKVHNSGTPIPEENLEYIWDRYFTARQQRLNGTKSGLGLAIAKEILEGHGAGYGVSSDLQNGTVFWFSLPFSN